MATIEIRVPDIGDMDKVEVIELLVAPGDTVAVEDSLLTVESDKASLEIPSSAAGVIESLSVAVGSEISQGDLIAVLTANSDGATPTASTGAPAVNAVSTTDSAPANTASATDTASAATSTFAVVVPDIGGATDVEVIEVLVKSGDTVHEEQSLVTLESDKAGMEVPAPQNGTVTDILVSVGDKVSEGSTLMNLLTQASSANSTESADESHVAAVDNNSDSQKAQAVEHGNRPANSPTAHIPDATSSNASTKIHASPAVRRYAREHGADLHKITGSGRKSRILKTDVKAFIRAAMEGSAGRTSGDGTGSGIPTVPDIDFSKFGEIEQVPLGRISKLSARNLHRAWLNVPAVTHHDEADITEMEAFRKALKQEAREGDPKVTGLAFHMKALVQSLKAYPKLNSSITSDGESLIYKKYYHIGIAVDTSKGLVVPVFRDVDKKSITDLAAEMDDISKRARDNKLKAAEMQGASMTISNLGGIGGTAFSPIVNTPEVAILGLARARMQPIWNGSEFIPRLMCPVDLSYDHRVVDGADAARFVTHYCKTISDIRRMLI